MLAQKPRRWKQILGAAVFDDSSIYIDTSLHARRKRFTQAHEIAHLMIPWHETAFRIDDERQLFFDTENELEAEANAAAAHILFQGNRYHERAAALPVSIQAPIDLAYEHDSSIHSSIRYFVEQHELPVAVLVTGRYAQFDGTLPIWQLYESDAFLAQYGRFADHVPSSGLPVDDSEYVIGALAMASFETTSPPAETVTLQDADGHNHRFIAESFFNQYTVFVMVSPKRHDRPRRARR
ncbi:MAG: ImmA/IrrE family metallo-endopeptidase [Actinomycetota bacterium]|nr:ImmA/IrrE family metallo-endopeptidase [Actinomycetota bacterium]